jgi:predicted permease
LTVAVSLEAGPVNGALWADQLAQDFRFAIRSLRRSPGLTLVIVLTLSISVAVVTTFFGFVNSILRPLPYKDAYRTVWYYKSSKVPDDVNGELLARRVFDRLTTYHENVRLVVASGSMERDFVTDVDSSFFPMLAPRVLLGALPSPAEVHSGATVAVLAERFWRHALNADPAVIGQTIRVAGTPRRVMGVIADGFTIPDITDVWVPAQGSIDRYEEGGANRGTLARFYPGVTRPEVQRTLDLINARLRVAYPTLSTRFPPVVIDKEMVNRHGGWGGPAFALPLLYRIIAGAGCVLLIACMNIALLLLARGGRRRGEMIVRASLGASSWQLARQQLVESLVLAIVSAIVGTLLTIWGTRLVVAILPPMSWAGWVKFGIDWRVASFAIAVSLGTVIIFGVWPARAGSRFNLEQVLRSDAGHGVVIGDATRSAHVPLVVQLTLSLTLFAGAMMLWLTVRQVANADRGYTPKGLFEVQISADPALDSTAADVTTLALRLRDALRSPGLEVSIYGAMNDFGGSPTDGRIYLPGADRPVVSDTEHGAGAGVVSDGYFNVMGTRLIAGRSFSPADAPGAMPVVIVSHTFAKRAWGTDNVVGKTLIIGKPSPDSVKKGKAVAARTVATVVGVAGDIRRSANANGQVTVVARPQVYVSDRQAHFHVGSVMIRTSSLSEARVQALVARRLSEMGRMFPVRANDMKVGVERETFGTRMLAWVTSIFAGACLLLALMGVYGIVAFGVEQRTREIGVRIALGAQGGDVVRAVMGRGAQLIGASLLIGLVVALLAAKVLAGFLSGTVAANFATSTGVAVVFGVVAMVASYLPARRAARLDPVVALRS